jgi:enamine deaminase RidA (YjgF/YER057c/UK114 family)
VLRPEGWPRPRGYADGIAARGRAVFVAGQVGWDARTGLVVSADFAEQTRAALQNVLAVLHAAGATPRHVTRLTWYVTDLNAYRTARTAVGAIFRELFAGHYPAMSVLQVSGLLEAGALVEIEATAVIPD